MNCIFFSKIGSLLIGIEPIIKCENTSAISSEAVDLEYSVKKPFVFLYRELQNARHAGQSLKTVRK